MRSVRGGCGRILAAAVLLASTSLTAAPQQAPAAPATSEGCTTKIVPAKLNFTMKDADDKKVKLADFKGKVIVLNFWATWCVPCKTEIPEFVELQKQFESQGVQFIGISVDDTPAKLRPYIAEHEMNYPVLQGKANEGVLDAYGPLATVPTTYLIKRDGNVCKRHSGAVTKDVLEHELKSLVH
jgi:cytochrome c biogenesis protein CcmG/thiol:disulfide interchange protein DsbE